MKYDLIAQSVSRTEDWNTFKEAINKSLEDGYELHGPTGAIYDGNSRTFFQALVKETQD